MSLFFVFRVRVEVRQVTVIVKEERTGKEGPHRMNGFVSVRVRK